MEPQPVTKIAWGLTAIVAALVLLAGTAGAADRASIFTPAPYVSADRVAGLAASGDKNAQAQLGWMYATGRGVPQDYYKAVKWYYLAAVQGQGFAQFQLGLAYNKGQGVRRDYTLSYMWLNLSASQAVGDDRDFKARIRDAVASKMTVAQLAHAQEMSLTWYNAR
jgi:TPR repeat protein